MDKSFAGLVVVLSDVHALGLRVANGLIFTTAFYWDLNDQTRSWSKRFFDRTGRMPGMVQAGTYSAVLHYLRAIEAAGNADGKSVAAKMREIKVDDFFAKGFVREDGRSRSRYAVGRSEETGRSEGRVGLLQSPEDHSGK